MTRQKEAPPVDAGRGGDGEPVAKQTPGNYTTARRKLPPFAKRFRPRTNGEARIIIGWPDDELESCCLVLPAGDNPAAFDWRSLNGCHVFVQPAPGDTASDGLLRDLGVELAEAGAASICLWSGEHIAGSWWRNQLDDPGFYDGFDDGDSP